MVHGLIDKEEHSSAASMNPPARGEKLEFGISVNEVNPLIKPIPHQGLVWDIPFFGICVIL